MVVAEASSGHSLGRATHSPVNVATRRLEILKPNIKPIFSDIHHTLLLI